MVFLPGNHVLDMNITVANKTGLAMCGESSSGTVATLICNGLVGLSFMNMTDLKVSSLAFTSCSRDYGITPSSNYAMLLQSTRDAKLFNCSFHDNLGTALVVNSTNIILAGNNDFVHNHCTESNFCVGGGGIATVSSNLTFIGNTTFMENNATYGAAGIYLMNCGLTSTGNIQFINNTNTGFSKDTSAGAIWASASSLHFNGTNSFIGNSAGYGGCAISAATNTRFRDFNHSLAGYGGAIYASDNSQLSFTGTNNFNSNSAVRNGGAICASDNSEVSFTGINNLNNNYAGEDGGVIYAKTDTLISFSGTSNFNHNSAKHGGAIYTTDNTVLNLTGASNFSSNSAVMDGGAICTLDNIVLSFNGTNVFINNIVSEEGDGGAIFTMYNTVIIFTGTNNFSNNSAVGDGGAICTYDNTVFSFTGTNYFNRNSAVMDGGAIIASDNSELSFTGTNNFSNNSAIRDGGVIYTYGDTVLSFTGANYFNRNYASQTGGAIYTFDNTVLSFTGTNNFNSNSAENGGAIYTVDNTILSFTGTNNFNNNCAAEDGGMIHAKINTSFCFCGNSHFNHNSAIYGGAIYIGLGIKTALNFTGTSSFNNNSVAWDGGAIYAWNNSKVSFNGTSYFNSNSAAGNDGGGALYLSNSKLFILPNTSIYWKDNHARFGGAIYIEDAFPFIYCTLIDTYTPKEECFFQLPNQNLSIGIDAQLVFKNNSADDAGSVLYGGAIDTCRLTGLDSYSSGEVFDLLVHIEDDDTTSSISSDPFRICPCENNHPNCSKSYRYSLYPGETFYVSVVAYGQRNGAIPVGVRSHIRNGTFQSFQYKQQVKTTCTTLNYTVFALYEFFDSYMYLYADGLCQTFSDRLLLHFNINQTCPPGFQLSESASSCVCEQRLAKYTNQCNITTGLGRITRDSHQRFWVGYDNQSCELILHPLCSFDYCVSHKVDFPLNNTDMQCAYNRSGLLCGACKRNYSLLLGTSQCKRCTNSHVVLLIPFAVTGVALVFLLLVCKLTVATGTLSGLVFYANIVGVNRTIFLPVKSTDAFSVFIAWLNLDFGIETCFFDGMDAYSKTWLQFVFPAYILVIVGLVIFSSHFSRRFTKFLGNNPVSILATLILLSYAKILRTLITAIYIAYLEYPMYQRWVWLHDANIDYLSGKHIPLFLVAVLVFLFLFLPYTVILLFGQWLQAISHLKLFSWVNRLKPFMDSYHAPYKPRHRYWPGLLLVFRFVLLLVFAFSPQQDPRFHLVAILVGTGILIVWAWVSGGIYKNWCLDALEGSFALNLIILAAATTYTYNINRSEGNQLAVGYTSVSIALATFIGIFAIQLVEMTGLTQYLKRMYKALKRPSERVLEDSLPDRLVNTTRYELMPHVAPTSTECNW